MEYAKESLQIQGLADSFADPYWRLTNLYKVSNKESQSVLYTPNFVQQNLFEHESPAMVVLKARQQGVSTWGELIGFDEVLWHENFWCAIIAHERSTLDILFTKIQFAWDNLDPDLKAYVGDPKSDNKYELYWRNRNSRIYVSLEVLGGTNQRVHFSEYALIDNQRIANTLPTVPPTGRIVKESTPFGTNNKFYRDYVAAKANESSETAHFFAWWLSPEYRTVNRGVTEDNLTSAEKSLIDNNSLNFEQIQWRRDQWKELKQPDGSNLFQQTYIEDDISCFMASGDSVFDAESVKSRLSYVKNSKKVFVSGHLFEKNERIRFAEDDEGPLRIYEAPKREGEYSVGCLPDGETVLTDKGWKAVETVLNDDYLIDAEGKMVKPLHIIRRIFSGKLYGLKPSNTTKYSWFTGEHPIMVLADTKLYRQYGSSLREDKRYRKLDVIWKKAEDVRVGDIVRFPLRFTEELSSEVVNQFLGSQKAFRKDRLINPDVLADPDFWFFIGLWLGDGWIHIGKKLQQKKQQYYEFRENYSHCRVSVVFNKTEIEPLERLEKIVSRLFNRKLCKTVKESVIETHFSCEAVYWFLYDNFGQKAQNKSIPEWSKALPKNCKLELIKGFWWSDGCCVKDNSKQYDFLFRFVSVSEKLLHDVQDLLISIDVLPFVNFLRDESIHDFGKLGGGKYKTKKTYSLGLGVWESAKLADMLGIAIDRIPKVGKRLRHSCWIENGFIYLKVRDVKEKEYTGQVNNFETLTHTFCTPFITTHNCDVSLGGPKSDDQVSAVLRRGSLDLVAMYVNRTEIGIFAEDTANLAKFYNMAHICPERNSIGEAFIEHLLELYPNEKIYRQQNRLQTGSKTRVSRFGYATTRGRNVGKQRLITLIQDWLRDNILIWDIDTLEQMLAYQRLDLISPQEGYKMGAKAGNKDDRIIGVGLALEMDAVLPVFRPKLELLQDAWEKEFQKARRRTRQQEPHWAAY